MAECYRHPGVETGVSCSSCGRPICPDCMTPTPVGMRCPECSQEKTRVVSGPDALTGGYPATKTLIGLCVLAYLLEIASGSGGLSPGSSSVLNDFGLRGIFVADGQWYRLITSGFLHVSIFHLAFNMIALYFLGRLLEPSIGTPRFLSIYFASMLAGSFGAILVSGSLVNTVGASGAVFGIFGASFIIARGRGMNHIAREIGVILGINLLLTFTVSGISIGGHLGGLAGGVLCGMLVVAGERGKLGGSAPLVEYGSFAAIAIISAVGAIAVSEPPPPGIIIGLGDGGHSGTAALVGLGCLAIASRRDRWHCSMKTRFKKHSQASTAPGVRKATRSCVPTSSRISSGPLLSSIVWLPRPKSWRTIRMSRSPGTRSPLRSRPTRREG